MDFLDMLKMRRSVYALDKNLPISKDELLKVIQDTVRYVPDAFDMKSQRVMVLLGGESEDFWENVNTVFVRDAGVKVSEDKIDSFKAGYGTILFFYDSGTVDEYKKRFSLYAENFDNWAMQSNAMLQFAIWTAFASLSVGASLQHYNPIIDKMVRAVYDVPENWVLIAQMPFGGISVKPEPKQSEDVDKRIRIVE